LPIYWFSYVLLQTLDCPVHTLYCTELNKYSAMSVTDAV